MKNVFLKLMWKKWNAWNSDIYSNYFIKVIRTLGNKIKNFTNWIDKIFLTFIFINLQETRLNSKRIILLNKKIKKSYYPMLQKIWIMLKFTIFPPKIENMLQSSQNSKYKNILY